MSPQTAARRPSARGHARRAAGRADVRHHRRLSGPIARPVPSVALPAPSRRGSTGAFERLRALPEHRVVDRLLRSRLWIWVVGVLLGGIVAMQVSLLKLNSGISRAVETTTTLERQNADLEAAIARLSAPDRIESGASSLGMLMPPAGDVTYLSPGAQDPAKAVRRMQPPSEDAAALLANHGIVPGSVVAAAPAPVTPAAATDPAAATTPTPATTPDPAVTPAPAATAAPVVTPAPTTVAPPTTTSQTPASGGAVAGQG